MCVLSAQNNFETISHLFQTRKGENQIILQIMPTKHGIQKILEECLSSPFLRPWNSFVLQQSKRKNTNDSKWSRPRESYTYLPSCRPQAWALGHMTAHHIDRYDGMWWPRLFSSLLRHFGGEPSRVSLIVIMGNECASVALESHADVMLVKCL